MSRWVLMYHKVDLSGSPYSVDPGLFREQIAVVAELNRLLPPDQETLITFDDGHESHYSTAFPILKHNSVCGVFFIVTDWVSKPGYVSWSEVVEMSNGGMKIGSHTVHHFNLATQERSVVQSELMHSKERIEDEIGLPCSDLALPGGFMPKGIRDIAGHAGYRSVYTSTPRKHTTNDMLVPRVAVTSRLSPETLAILLRGEISPFLMRLRVKDSLRRVVGPSVWALLHHLRNERHREHRG